MKTSRGLIWVIVVLAFVSIASAQAGWDNTSAPYKAQVKKAAILISEPALPSQTALEAMSLNQRGAVADLLWLKTIQYFGVGNPYGMYPSLGSILDTITKLDPKFQYPYEFGMIVLPFMGQTDTAVRIGERAQTAIPNNGLLTFYLASAYHLSVKDYQRAGDLYIKASTEADAPKASKELAGVAYASNSNSLSDRQVALAFWEAAFDNAKDDVERERAANWYQHMQIVYALELASQKYHENTGAYPKDFQALIDAKLIPGVPESPIGRIFILDPETGRVDFTQIKRPS